MGIRKSVYSLPPGELALFFQGVKALKASGVYDNFVLMHYAAAQAVHHNPLFLPWHRAFLLDFESQMRNQLGMPGWSLPYWDWTEDAAAPGHVGRVWNDALFGMPKKIGEGPVPRSSDRRGEVKSGPFTADQWKTYNPQPGSPSDWTPVLKRNLSLANMTFPTAPSIVALLNDNPTFGPSAATTTGFVVALEDVHDNVHPWVGGQMEDPFYSPNDPIFWLHHCNIDRIWAQWQQMYPTATLSDPKYPTFGPNLQMPSTYPGRGALTVAQIQNIYNSLYSYDRYYDTGTTELLMYTSLASDNTLRWSDYDAKTGFFAPSRFTSNNTAICGPGMTSYQGLIFAAFGASSGTVGGEWAPLCYAVHDPVNGAWTQNKGFDQGNQTTTRPALAASGDVMICVHRGNKRSSSDDTQLYWTAYDRLANGWSVDALLPGVPHSDDGPALVAAGGKIYCAFKGDGTPDITLFTYDVGSQSWSSLGITGARSAAGPALAVLGDTLYLVYRGETDDILRWRTAPVSGPGFWSDEKLFPLNRSSVAPAVVAWQGKLVCVHKGGADDTNIYATVFDPAKAAPWSDDIPLPGATTYVPVGLVSLTRVKAKS